MESRFLELFGGALCLDFANTVDGRATAHPRELLHSYADLASWSSYAGLTTAPLRGTPADLAHAVELREAIFDVFAAIGRGAAPPSERLATIQAHYVEAVSAAHLASTGNGYDWQFTGGEPGRAWWPVAISAVRLLTAGPLDRVKVCAAEAGCIGLFLDTSKNRSRRWCTMDGCGVEAKIQRQSARRRAARET